MVVESQIREVLKRCLSYKIVEEVPIIKYQLETNCMFSYDKNGNIVGETYSGSHSLDEWKEIVEKELENVTEGK